MRMRFDSYVHQWQVVSSDTLQSAIDRVPPAVTRSPWVLTQGVEFGEVEFEPAEAKVWLVNEWELYDQEMKLDVPALTRSARVAGTALMPRVAADIVRFNSTYPDELMGGGIPFVLSPFHQWALNLYTDWEGRGLPLRRGWFGQYIFNVPAENSLSIRRNGAPLAGATVEVFQLQDNVVHDLVKYVGTTGANGRFDFPQQTTQKYAEFYGLSAPLETPSPFSTIYSDDLHVLGTNGVLVLRITDTGGNRAYRFIDVMEFNLAYARGNVQQASYVIDVGAAP
jgi:hypothetical protein